MASIHEFPSGGLLPIRGVLKPGGPVPVGRSTWYAGIKTGRFPKPVRVGPRLVAWKKKDIDELLLRLMHEEFEV